MATALPSGDQWTIRHDDHEAVIVQVGGGLRTYRADGRDVIFGYPEDAKSDAGRGHLLMPWPNRIRDGKYTFAGKDQQLALTEPARSNASHGLVRWADWSVVQHDSDAIVVEHLLRPQPGWDWTLRLQVAYTLSALGLMVTPAATNLSDTPAPFGYGVHPYLTAGEDTVDELTLTLPGSRTITVDERLLPIGSAAVEGTPYDFRAGRAIGTTQLDHCYADLTSNNGRWVISLDHGGTRTTLWADATRFPYAQAFTGDTLPPGRVRRTGVALEPMTCPADAFNNGEGLLTLEPGQTWTGSWGISPG
ncbi:aldose 1-epimerase family protein [Allobranchiibius sp. GilTou38]|uniref:aldose 1-epimerase family protein n=1 Tax=Allobranchiibius sp. GilTou38 TaxID=2815210 RepID=UPI001AA1C6B2|nr:aldose 1-epimerase family protein [Allobranchiibius sp. GilTou38]MBO1765989.1 aldose 1-epimerase family protein [Allobranchiibius sp. GilTou38]